MKYITGILYSLNSEEIQKRFINFQDIYIVCIKMYILYTDSKYFPKTLKTVS